MDRVAASSQLGISSPLPCSSVEARAAERFRALIPRDEGFGQDQDSPQEGDAPDRAGEGGVQPLMVVKYVPVGAAHSQTVVFASANHYAFDDCLPAISSSWLFRQCLLPFDARGEALAHAITSWQAEGDHKKTNRGLKNIPRFR